MLFVKGRADMNNIARRIIAGVSAAALFVSAVGSDAFMGIFGSEIYAVSAYTSKNGKSTGFGNLEQDTYYDTAGNLYYNTGYGLHTNKTATAVGADGRTFDVNLESWYVGENPVDVATILDASGSMAWTVDTLEPLEISSDIVDDIIKTYSINDLNEDGKTDINDIIIWQNDKNDGYLPQDVVDKILNPENTDNSKLSYSDYLYYIYEARSSVSEFVPLGYWDGGEPSGALKPIGYYKFDGSLKNEVNGKNATYIKHPAEGDTYDDTDVATQEATVTYTGSNGIDISKTAPVGALKLDLGEVTDTTNKQLVVTINIGSNAPDSSITYDETSILYITDGTYFYKISRGGSSSKNRLRISTNTKSNFLNANAVFDSSKKTDANKWTFTFDFNKKNLTVTTTTAVNLDGASGNETTYTTDDTCSACFPDNFDLTKLQIYVGGATEAINSYSEVFVGSVNIKAGEEIADYDFTSGSLKNKANDDAEAILVEQAYSNSGAFGTDKLDGTEAKPVYAEGGLDLNKTAKNGAIMLDVVPQIADDKDGFTISLQIRKSGSSLSTTGNNQRNIFYFGDKDTSKNNYYQFFRSAQAGGYLALVKGKQNDFASSNPNSTEKESYTYYRGGLNQGDTWYTSTLVFKPVDGGKYKITPYINGDSYEKNKTIFQTTEPNTPEMESITVDSEDLVFLLGALQNNAGDEGTHFIKNLYIFDEALTDDQVALVAQDKMMEDPKAEDCESYHATTSDGKQDIAQISKSLRTNPDDDQREGWYYVNSHSVWADISGCLEGGKQYLGIVNDIGLGTYNSDPSELVPGGSGGKVTEPATGYEDDNQSIATIPSVYQAAYDEYVASSSSGSKPDDVLGAERAKYYEYYEKLQKGNDSTKTFTPSANERSIQFYVDEAGYLRCFYCTGDFSWKKSGDEWSYSPRTFCSVVYVKEKYDVEKRLTDGTNYGNPTKYEELNFALNQFYQNLANSSDLSNTAIVRFSTHNLIQGDSESEAKENAVNHLKMLIMEDWTNYSDVYSNDNTDKKDYLQNLLIPAVGETSVPSGGSDEYPYVMTGGTYTWTGLKAFYDNMVDTTGTKSGDTVYNIANDARDKYLIIFTDGRDNLVGNTKDQKYVKFATKDGKVTSYGNFAPEDEKGDQQNLTYDSELAKAWADKLKEEGYTIFCVMLATGSISPTTNEEEYTKAHDFLKTLAGDKDGKRTAEDCISVVGEGDSTLEKAFADILSKIQQPRQDYTVQDYIDPRFDLIDKDDNVYHLGAGGKITVTDKDGKDVITGLKLSDGSEFTNGSAVGNIIDNIGKTDIVGLAYTPQDSYMVNRKADSASPDGYTTGDGVGTGYLYYDDEKDMYYLRWTDQIIPMENESFDTDDGGKKLDVWSATIRLKAKDDFIGGNYILTNGNEAGENLVYSDATIENMDKGENYKLYGFESTDLDTESGKVPYRQKLEALSGTNRKINAVDAGGVSQAVYGDGIDIPSSGFPRVTVNVRLLPLNAYDLSDVIYMGEVVSPTMMLADLENNYMTGSYYLQYLERYAYRVYGEDATKKPLLELLNQWLKINVKDEESKTFTIPYIYLPDPEYDEDGKLIAFTNSTGASYDTDKNIDFADLNLRDVTGFITYTWKREYKEGEDKEPQQNTTNSSGETINDITKEYVVKNTNQIKYNLQLKFTPLKENKEDLNGFSLDENFIIPDPTTSKGGDKFFNIVDGEFEKMTTAPAWTTDYGRKDYLQAMISETKTYEPHVMYDTGNEKWVLVDNDTTGFTPTDAVNAYTADDQTVSAGDNKVTDKGVYDWDKTYKPVPKDDKEQIEEVDNINDYYTDTPENVKLVDKDGNNITDDTGEITPGREPCSLVANTTYTKDVVNAALALELVVDGKYLQSGSPIEKDKEYTFIATRYYDDPLDPLPYDSGTAMNADTVSGGKKYQLTFTVDETSLPENPKPDQIYTVWATLSEVKVDTDGDGTYNSSITVEGYTDNNALPIGTYEISVTDDEMKSGAASDNQYYIGNDGRTNIFFQYLKTDSTSTNYTHDKFPDSVSSVSETAAESTGDGDYQIWNEKTDNSKKNIAENDRTKDTTEKTQTVTFYFGTVDGDDIGKKGESTKDHLTELVEGKYSNEYTKDRLGIILLSVDPNSLAISKEVTNTSNPAHENKFWQFTVTFTPNTGDNADEFKAKNATGFDLQWYKGDDSKLNTEMGTDYPKGGSYPSTINFTDDDNDGTYTATIYLKHNEKVVIKGLQEGTWQVEEVKAAGLLYTPHNDMYTLEEVDENSWLYENSPVTAQHNLQPASYVDYVNEFPYDLPSAGGIGTNILIYSGITFMLLSGLSFAILCRRGRSRDKPKG